MKPGVLQFLRELRERIANTGCEIVDGGLEDRTEIGMEIGERFARERVDMVSRDTLIYTPSAIWMPN